MPEKVERFLKLLNRKGIRVREFDKVLATRALEDAAGGSEVKALQLYQALPVSDQAQMREFYLSRIEELEPGLRTKYKQLYQYY